MSRKNLVERTIHEHRAIYEAFVSRDEEKVEALTIKHLAGILEYEDVVLEDM